MENSGANRILLDTYAWIEYFRGSGEGEHVREIIESGAEVITPTIVIAELSDKYRRSGKKKEWEDHRGKSIEVMSRICTLSPDSADEAGKIKREERKKYADFPLADGMILAIAKESEAKVLTGDKHMRDLPQAINLKHEGK